MEFGIDSQILLTEAPSKLMNNLDSQFLLQEVLGSDHKRREIYNLSRRS